MEVAKKYIPFYISAILLCVLVFVLYPYYQYYIDPDGVSYLTVSKRYANGDFAKAINGYWSPWGCWLTAILIRVGLAAIPSSVIVNTAGAIGFLGASQALFLRFAVKKDLQYGFCSVLAYFLCFAIFWQSFDDLWECFFLLLILKLYLSESFLQKASYWVLAGVLGAFALFAKAYAFPFFIINTICCLWVITKGNIRTFIKTAASVFGVLAICSAPWVYFLHEKYGKWLTSTAGGLNMSWYLVGHPIWDASTKFLVRPIYPDSPYYWEDPYLVNAAAPHFWDSVHLFGLQIVRVGYTFYKFLVSLIQISIFFPIVVYCAGKELVTHILKYLKPAKAVTIQQYWKQAQNSSFFILAISIVIFPMGYMLINFEPRYIWYLIPLGLVTMAQLAESKAINAIYIGKYTKKVFLVSFLVYPVWQMVILFNEGKREYNLAEQLKVANIHGSFTSNRHPRYMGRLAYFSGNPYFYNTQPSLKTNSTINTKFASAHFDSLLQEMQKNKVKYYLHFTGLPDDDNPGVDLHFYENVLHQIKPVANFSGLEVVEVLDGVRGK